MTPASMGRVEARPSSRECTCRRAIRPASQSSGTSPPRCRRGRAKDGAQLRADKLRAVQHHADAPLAEKRVVLARQRQIRQAACRRRVERPTISRRPGPSAPRHVAADGVLLLLGRSGRPRCRNRNSDRSRPTASAPSATIPCSASPSPPISPPPRRDGRRASSPARAPAPDRRCARPLILPASGGCGRYPRSTGSGATCPGCGRGSPGRPSQSSARGIDPATSGISSDRARIATCDDVPPSSYTVRARAPIQHAVSEGVSSSATRIVSAS